MAGCRKRMGQDWQPNRAISNPLMGELLSLAENKVRDADSQAERQRWLLAGGYFCICYVFSLISPEGLMVDLEGLIKFNPLTTQRESTVVPLLGRVKGESHTRQHLLTSVNVTSSGIQVKAWVQRILAVHRLNRRSKGPAFINIDGLQASTADMNDLFLEALAEIYESQPDLFAVDIKSAGDIADKYNVFRSFRRGSESRAVAKKVSEADRYIVHRWKKKEAAGANRVNHSIDQHYVDISLVTDSFLRYTQAM